MKDERSGDERPKTGDEAALPAATGSRSDTERLDFLLRFLSVEDVGDEDFILGVVVSPEALEEAIGVSGVLDWKEDLRTIIDRAINHYKKTKKRAGKP
jgi:hypothetical protein